MKNKFKRINIILHTHQQMDLNQRKLNKSEWDSIEIPVSKSEKDILNLIMLGFHDVNIRKRGWKSNPSCIFL